MRAQSNKLKGKEKQQAQQQDLNKIIAQLTQDLEVEKKASKELQEEYNLVKKENQEMSKDLKNTKKELNDKTNSTNQLESQLNAIIKETRVPIVAAVVLKAIYKKGAGVKKPGPVESANSNDTRRNKIWNAKGEFSKYGCENEGQMVELADSVCFISFYHNYTKG